MNSLTVYEASKKYKKPTRYFRQLIERGNIKAKKFQTGQNAFIWMIAAKSLKEHLKTKPKQGRPPTKK